MCASSASTVILENLRDHPLMTGLVVVAMDATKDRTETDFRKTIDSIIRSRDNFLHGGDTMVVLGVLHEIQHPMGYQMQARAEDFVEDTQIRIVEEQVLKKVNMYVGLLQPITQELEQEGIDIEVKVVAGTPRRRLILQELVKSHATWGVLDRHLRRDLKFYLEKIPCKIALVHDDLSLEVVRPFSTNVTDNTDHKLLFSMSKSVNTVISEQCIVSRSSSARSLESDIARDNLLPSSDNVCIVPKQERSGRLSEEGDTYVRSAATVKEIQNKSSLQRSSDAPVLCTGCGIKTKPDNRDSMRFRYSELKLATDNFSKEYLLGEGGYGLVYKGKLKDGQLIAAKVRKESSSQGLAEFHSEIYVLNFARHKNIVMLLGYCSKENFNILVYEYVCNKSLEWHLFDSTENILEWCRRYAIAIGTAKGLRFLHEECRGSPIIHRDIRPSNILLTHDFVPMLGDFGLAKWRTKADDEQKTLLGTLGYLSPEYVEDGTVSVRTDVFSFGIVLIQLISGRKAVDPNTDGHRQSLRQWAVPLIQRLALHELIDHRIQDSCDMYELYNMARAAYLCVQTNPEMRPSMAEILRLLEGENDDLAEQFVLHMRK